MVTEWSGGCLGVVREWSSNGQRVVRETSIPREVLEHVQTIHRPLGYHYTTIQVPYLHDTFRKSDTTNFSHSFPDLVLTSSGTCPTLLLVFPTFHRRTWENPGRKEGEIYHQSKTRSGEV
jgi:hypothetical protein